MSWDDAQESLELATLDSTVRRVAALWTSLDGRERGNLTRKDRALTNALYALVEHLAGQKFERPAVHPEPEPEPEGYPAEKRIADLEGFLEARHVRREALHHARKSFEQHTEDPWNHARDVVAVAQVFEKYLTGNTGDEEPTSTVATVTTWPGPDFPTRPDIAAVITAAVIWADRAHFLNPSGPENWRRWSDEHDQELINAVAVLTGRPQINNKEKP